MMGSRWERMLLEVYCDGRVESLGRGGADLRTATAGSCGSDRSKLPDQVSS
jgi:hypothetical protein